MESESETKEILYIDKVYCISSKHFSYCIVNFAIFAADQLFD